MTQRNINDHSFLEAEQNTKKKSVFKNPCARLFPGWDKMNEQI